MKLFNLKFALLFVSVFIASVAFGQTKELDFSDFENPFTDRVQEDTIAPITPAGNSGDAFELPPVTPENGTFYVNLEKQNIPPEALISNEGQNEEVLAINHSISDWLGFNENHTFLESASKDDDLGFTHTTYQHYYKGILVEGSALIVHIKDNVLSSINGRVVEFDDVESNAAISPEQAEEIAKSYLDVTDLIHEYPIEKVVIRVPGTEEAEVSLAIRVRIDSYEPFEMCYIYVDAMTGEVLNKINLVAHADVPATADTYYSGNQNIICDSHQGGYRLRESGRNIQTYDATFATDLTINGFTGSTDFTNTSTSWDGVPTLNSFTISSVSTHWWYTWLFDEIPDLYIVVKNGSDQIVYVSGYYNNTFPTVTWNNLDIYMTNPPYKVEIWDYNPVFSDDFGGSYTINPNSGTHSWAGNGNNGTYNITSTGHPALDVHWGMEMSYDFFLNVFGRDSYDGMGSVIKQYVNPPNMQIQKGNDPNNAGAYVDPYNFMVYGMGDGQYMGPVVELDVTGHEFTHMVIDHNGNGGLIYQGESGALNESFADIFGASIDFFAGINPSWNIGENSMLSQPYLRSMSDPKSVGDPDTYQGQNWVNPNNLSYDKGGVHINSGVQNYWFYLLSEGGSGTNDLGNPYSVNSIGISDAQKIAYRNLMNYLTPDATFMDAFYGSLQSAEDLFGNPSSQYNAVREAWYAVGIGNDPASYCSGSTTLTASSGTFSDGSGSSNYLNNSNCTWVIAPPGATQISLNFTHFDTEADFDIVNVYDGPDDSYPVLSTWWGNTLPPTITTSPGVGAMTVKFVSDGSITYSGWNASYNSTGITPTCGGVTLLSQPSGNFTDGSGTANYGNNQLCAWLISPPCASTVTLSFSQFYTEDGYDGVIVFDDWDMSNQLAVFTGTNLPNSITSYTGKMLVIFTSDYSVTRPGFAAHYTSSGSAYCSGTTNHNTADWGVISDGSGTDNYCNNMDCKWLIQPPDATSITLNFTKFDLEQASGDGQIYDAVEIYDGATTNAPLLGTFTGSNLPPTITSSSGSMLIHFHTDLMVTADGWEAIYTSTQDPHCSGTTTLTAHEGTFDDGSGNLEYANNSKCSWLIQPPGDQSITLSFTSFNTELDYDGVAIYDGENNTAPVLGQFTGSNIPAPVTSTGGSMYVEFMSDESVRGGGWEASYTSECETSSESEVTACKSYTWQGSTYSSSGTYQETIQNTVGCDSVMTLQLTINEADISVSNDEPTLKANAEGASYQWIKCENGNPIQGETNQTFTATANGSYAVIVTQNNCTDTSGCYDVTNVGLPETVEIKNGFKVYPNPSDGVFKINSEFTDRIYVKITDITGRLSYKSYTIEKGENTIDVSYLNSGVYLLLFDFEGKTQSHQIVIY